MTYTRASVTAAVTAVVTAAVTASVTAFAVTAAALIALPPAVVEREFGHLIEEMYAGAREA